MRYVVAIGGNALKEYSVMDRVARCIARAAGRDEIAVTHGNGPQVGELAMVESKNLAVLTAQTQAEIGIEVEKYIEKAMRRGSKRKTAIVLTRVVVDPDDPEFRNPTKPVGKFYGKAEAAALARKGLVMRKLMHGYRRVVPSPDPKDIVEAGQIHDLLSGGYIVIAAGGGGIAVARRGDALRYEDAVIDKDLASALLAEKTRADRMLLLTNVDGAYKDFGKRSRELVGRIGVRELEALAKEGHFEEGSMLPKVRACIRFVRKTGKIAVIGNLKEPEKAFALKGATIVVPS